MIHILTEEDYKNQLINTPPQTPFSKRRAKFYLDMFNNPLVDAKLLHFYNNQGKFIGECVLVFKDERTENEFLYEKHILNRFNACLIKNLFIEKQFQNQGYFTDFLKNIEQLCLKNNIKNLLLAVQTKNQHALDVYTHLGFSPTGERFTYSDIGEAIFMQKILHHTKRQSPQQTQTSEINNI